MKILIKHFTFSSILLLAIAYPTYAEDNKLTVGAGVGALYGNSLGVNVNYRILDRLDLIGAYGAYNRGTIGFQYHLSDNTKFFQPRISAIYGINGRLEVKDNDSNQTHEELFNGVSAGIGCKLAFGKNRRHGVNIDLLYRVYDGDLGERRSQLDKESRVKDPQYGDVTGVGSVFDSFRAYYATQLSVGWSYKF